MSLFTKVFLSILITTCVGCFCIGISFYNVFLSNIEYEYIDRYRTLGNVMRSSFQQMERLVDQINLNATRVLYETDKIHGVISNKNLIKLKKNLGITSLNIANEKGVFIRSTKLPIINPEQSLFAFCNEYRQLVFGNKNVYQTPIIPDSVHNAPAKFTMISNFARNRILESVVELKYIGKIFHHMIQTDRNIKSIGFYTPMGLELGYISENGAYSVDRKNIISDVAFGYKKVNDFLIFNIKIPANESNCCECKYKKVSSFNDEYYYILQLFVSSDSLKERINSLKIILFVIFGIVFLISIFVSKILARKLVSRIQKINTTANDILNSSNLNLKVSIPGKSDEISHLAETFNKMIHALKLSQEALVESEKMRTIAKIAGELAHDIRSPLAVMEITLASLRSDIADSQKLMLSEAIQNVRDIANNLLVRYRKTDGNGASMQFSSSSIVTQDDGNVIRPLLLSSIIEIIVSQKRQEWSNYSCSLNISISPNAVDQWIEATPNSIKRMLSNLLNNAYESLKDKREISIFLVKNNSHLCLKISDTGCGIPDEKINDVMNGLSLKHEGKGVGLVSSKHYLNSIGGELTLTSTESIGTEVVITFPIMSKPSWFSGVISLSDMATVVILDDDTSIHNLWRHRLQTYNIKLYHFLSSKEILRWRQDNASVFNDAILLIDYELKNDSSNGLALLEVFNPKARGYLITSHHEEVLIQQQCEKLGVNLIPKCLLGVVDIYFE